MKREGKSVGGRREGRKTCFEHKQLAAETKPQERESKRGRTRARQGDNAPARHKMATVSSDLNAGK